MPTAFVCSLKTNDDAVPIKRIIQWKAQNVVQTKISVSKKKESKGSNNWKSYHNRKKSLSVFYFFGRKLLLDHLEQSNQTWHTSKSSTTTTFNLYLQKLNCARQTMNPSISIHLSEAGLQGQQVSSEA